jgi:magnesium transporter
MNKHIDSLKEVAGSTTEAITKGAGLVGGTIRDLGLGLYRPVAATLASSSAPEPGAAPGIEQYLDKPGTSGPISITCITYDKDFLATEQFATPAELFASYDRNDGKYRWINVDGLSPTAVNDISNHFGIHTLAAEDVLNTGQRPKIEGFEDHLMIVARQIQLIKKSLNNEQITFFLFEDTLISFQEVEGDVFDPVRKRLEAKQSRFRTLGTPYLLYALIDTITDHIFPLLEAYGMVLDDLEEEIIAKPTPSSQQRLFSIKRDLSMLRRAIWPMREVIDHLIRDDSKLLKKDIRAFLRDVQDHIMQILDLAESFRETASGLNDLYQSSVANKMNETMKVLTIMASFFIPITFIAGVYGMNFEHMPELSWPYAYPTFWAVCSSVTIGLAIYFWKKGWMGGPG